MGVYQGEAMPQPTKNAPDAYDTFNMVSAIGEQFGLVVEFTCRYYADYVQVVARAYRPSIEGNGPVTHQALVKYKYGHKADRAQHEFTLAFDLWCQLDGGGATAAQRGATHDWQGRVQVPRQRS